MWKPQVHFDIEFFVTTLKTTKNIVHIDRLNGTSHRLSFPGQGSFSVLPRGPRKRHSRLIDLFLAVVSLPWVIAPATTLLTVVTLRVSKGFSQWECLTLYALFCLDPCLTCAQYSFHESCIRKDGVTSNIVRFKVRECPSSDVPPIQPSLVKQR